VRHTLICVNDCPYVKVFSSVLRKSLVPRFLGVWLSAVLRCLNLFLALSILHLRELAA
jgi:hypothetical protein